MTRKPTSKSSFLRDRLLNISDNLAANIIGFVLALALPTILGIILNLGIQTTILILLLICQAFVIAFLFSIRRKLSKPPRTKEEEMSSEACFSLNLLRRDIQTENGTSVLSFYVRNDSEYNIQIDSAKLVFNVDPPVAVTDISPRNRPNHTGLLSCKLLFNGGSEVRKLSPQEEARLDLILQKRLSTKETIIFENLSFCFMEIAGVFRDTQVSFHIRNLNSFG